MTRQELYKIRKNYIDNYVEYRRVLFSEFNYSILNNVMYIKRSGRGENDTYNDVIIMLDTETSKKEQPYKYDDFHKEIKEDLKHYNFKWDSKYKDEVADIFTLRSAGLKFSNNGTSQIDVYYEDLRQRYPWIFKNEAYNKYDALYYIYDYMNGWKETEKRLDNHVVAWTISIRAFNANIVTLYGHKPSDLVETMSKIHSAMQGDKTIFYIHNASYDWVFLRKFLFRKFGVPIKQLNTKAHYPISIEFSNGIILRDSLILAQRKLEKWAEDLDVEHKKQVGKWDYNKIRSQFDEFSNDELDYIECDTLAGVECIQKMMDTLNKKVYSMPYTATGVPREQLRKRGKENGAKDLFKRICLTYEQYKKMLKVYHGGYTHGNRHFVNTLIKALVRCFDFASSYPFVMLSEKYPMEKFTPFKDVPPEYIINNSDDYAFIFKLIMVNPKIKNDDVSMPALQFSKCTKTINAITDNGRILAASYAEIYLTEQDLIVINEQYDADYKMCVEVETARKDYLPRWFTDYVYECFENKCNLKYGDATLYAIAKAIVNCLYGMCVQKSIQDLINENYDTGEFDFTILDNEEEYEKYLKKPSAILPYQWGVWVTAYAFKNLFTLGKCCNSWYYSDTDSIYGSDWDEDALNAYNERCKEKLLANGYGAVHTEEKDFWLGVAEPDGDYTEFKYMGAKRYACRKAKDGQLKITVAGVPKKDGVKCLKDDLNNFVPGFCFDGATTGKLLHTYVMVDDIYIDEWGNETGDSIDLTPCDYILDMTDIHTWEDLILEDVEVQVYDEFTQ